MPEALRRAEENDLGMLGEGEFETELGGGAYWQQR